jgi:uncharacterized protein (DUF4415 family)
MKQQANPELIDDENPEWTDEDFAHAVPLAALPEALQTRLRGRPRSGSPKKAVKIRLDADVLEALRASGSGWQTRINAALRASLALSGKL